MTDHNPKPPTWGPPPTQGLATLNKLSYRAQGILQELEAATRQEGWNRTVGRLVEMLAIQAAPLSMRDRPETLTWAGRIGFAVAQGFHPSHHRGADRDQIEADAILLADCHNVPEAAQCIIDWHAGMTPPETVSYSTARLRALRAAAHANRVLTPGPRADRRNPES